MAPGTALTLCAFFLTITTSCAKLEVTTGPSSLTVKPGENVLLTCIVKVDKTPIDMKELTVQWFHRGKQIAEYDNKITIDRPGVSLSEEELKKGNASLFISVANVDNSGNYRCYIYYQTDFRMKQVVLAVEDPTQVKEDEKETLPDLCPKDGSQELLKEVNLLKKGMEQVQETLTRMTTNVEKCAVGHQFKAPQP